MSYLANRFTVFLDANVLFSNRKRDLLLSFGEYGLCRVRWSEDVEHEWTENLKVKRPDLIEKIPALVAKMNTAFPEANVSGYEQLSASLKLPDPNDLHVLAAAIRCGAQIIVTDNLRDFPNDYLAEFDLEALTADHFLTSALDLFPYDGLQAVKAVRERLKDPSISRSAFVMDLAAKGLPLLAASLRDKRDFI
ncbi:PIN domain-containing protein [Roseovarius sp.]|uniref:PIN domain-containing protein n=1 Tax=Roseovarius sp. TaxID=1486281 RepID=UPI0035668DA9